jgi:hypothetical protein
MESYYYWSNQLFIYFLHFLKIFDLAAIINLLFPIIKYLNLPVLSIATHFLFIFLPLWFPNQIYFFLIPLYLFIIKKLNFCYFQFIQIFASLSYYLLYLNLHINFKDFLILFEGIKFFDLFLIFNH